MDEESSVIQLQIGNYSTNDWLRIVEHLNISAEKEATDFPIIELGLYAEVEERLLFQDSLILRLARSDYLVQDRDNDRQQPANKVIATEDVDQAFEAADEALWDEQFANSPDILDFLAREGREEYYAGLADEFDPDNDPDAP